MAEIPAFPHWLNQKKQVSTPQMGPKTKTQYVLFEACAPTLLDRPLLQVPLFWPFATMAV